MAHSALMQKLIQTLRHLPGVGPKTAQRMAYHLLLRQRAGADALAQTLKEALEKVGRCRWCRTLTEEEYCSICRNPRRQQDVLCVVENPADVIAIEQSGSFSGLYFVLMGRISPLEGVGPEVLGMEQLLEGIRHRTVKEVIVATNPTVEGEATAYYLIEILKPMGLTVTRIAHGVPMGGELEYLDARTLARALVSRAEVS